MQSILDVVRGGYLGELNEQQSEYLRRLHRRVSTMLTMISELMALAKSRSEKIRVAEEPVDLAVVAGRVDRTFRDEAVQKGIEFKVTVPEGLPAIRGDAAMIEQMLENLVSNSIKYTPKGGKVCVTFSSGAGNVRIEVGDTGIGIPKADLPNLFKEFYRAENAKAIEAHGTGLGLPIVKEIVDKHGGRIVVQSEEGLGTIFVVFLPVDRRPRDNGESDSRLQPEAGRGQPQDGAGPGGGQCKKPLARSTAAAVEFVRRLVEAEKQDFRTAPGRGSRARAILAPKRHLPAGCGTG